MKQYIPLGIGLSIPLALILVVAAMIYLPGRSAPLPQYDFLYSTGEYSYGYRVSAGRLEQDPFRLPELVKPGDTLSQALLFAHNTKENKSREVTFEEARALKFDPTLVSPDGYQVAQGGGGGMPFPFVVEQRYDQVFLKGHNTAKEMHVRQVGYYTFRFLGWIIN